MGRRCSPLLVLLGLCTVARAVPIDRLGARHEHEVAPRDTEMGLERGKSKMRHVKTNQLCGQMARDGCKFEQQYWGNLQQCAKFYCALMSASHMRVAHSPPTPAAPYPASPSASRIPSLRRVACADCVKGEPYMCFNGKREVDSSKAKRCQTKSDGIWIGFKAFGIGGYKKYKQKTRECSMWAPDLNVQNARLRCAQEAEYNARFK